MVESNLKEKINILIKKGMTNKFKKCHLIAIQEIAVSSTAMTHTYWTAPISEKVMALYYDLSVFKDVYQMTLRIFQVTTNFPRDA